MYTYIHIKICTYSVEPPRTRVCVCVLVPSCSYNEGESDIQFNHVQPY